MSIHFERKQLHIKYIQAGSSETCAEHGKKCGALLFSLNFLWLLSLFQDKESDNKDSGVRQQNNNYS